MADLTRLSAEASEMIFEIVERLQPATAEQVREELASRYGVCAERAAVVHYMEWLRSSFPRKLAHAGPDLWILVDLS